LNYNVIAQPVRSAVAQKPATVYRPQKKQQSPTVNRVQTYEEEEEVEEEIDDEDADNYDDQENAEDVSINTTPSRRKRRDRATRVIWI
jgi:hypothetical protein